MVYIAAFAPDNGESVSALIKEPPPGAPVPPIYATVEGRDDAQLAKSAQGIPNAKTVADQIGLFAMHDSYNVGQMAFVRKGLGYPGIDG